MHIEEFIWLYFSSRTSLSMLRDGVWLLRTAFATYTPSSGESLFMGFHCFRLLFEKNLNAICGPGGDSSSEEIRIFCPHATCETEGCGQHRPIVLIATTQPGSGFTFKSCIKL